MCSKGEVQSVMKISAKARQEFYSPKDFVNEDPDNQNYGLFALQYDPKPPPSPAPPLHMPFSPSHRPTIPLLLPLLLPLPLPLASYSLPCPIPDSELHPPRTSVPMAQPSTTASHAMST